MSSRHRLAIVVLSLAAMLACKGRRTGTGSGSGTGTATSAAGIADAGSAVAPAVDASLADGTLQLVAIDVLTAPKVFQERAAGAGARPMEPLVAAAKAAVQGIDTAQAGALGDTVIVWIAVRPGKQVRAWVATPGKTDATVDAARADVTGRMAAAVAPEVTGPVAFAVFFDRSGKRPRLGGSIPIPPELEQVRASAGPDATPEALIGRAWTP